MDSETQQLNLFKVRGVRHPEYWQCIEYVAPSNEKKEWKASEAEAVFCKECKTTIPYHSSKNSKGVTRHMNKFHEDLLQNFRRKRNNAGEVKIDTGEKLTVLQSKAFDGLFTKIRDQETTPLDFKRYSDRLMNILAEECLGDIGSSPVEVKTPTGATYMGTLPSTDICVVSIVRAGDSLLNAVLRCEPSLPVGSYFCIINGNSSAEFLVGKILIQRDESTEAKTPRMYYSKLPPRIASMNVLLVDPMLATGGSAKMAIKVGTKVNRDGEIDDIGV